MKRISLQLCYVIISISNFQSTGQDEFTERDVEVFKRYLTFCGIGIQNAQLFENSVLEYKRNQILLNLASSIFEEQNNLECLVTKIMKEARDLLKCERCAVFLVDLECCEAVVFLIHLIILHILFSGSLVIAYSCFRVIWSVY